MAFLSQSWNLKITYFRGFPTNGKEIFCLARVLEDLNAIELFISAHFNDTFVATTWIRLLSCVFSDSKDIPSTPGLPTAVKQESLCFGRLWRKSWWMSSKYSFTLLLFSQFCFNIFWQFYVSFLSTFISDPEKNVNDPGQISWYHFGNWATVAKWF